jgi:hypothetical protein
MFHEIPCNFFPASYRGLCDVVDLQQHLSVCNKPTPGKMRKPSIKAPVYKITVFVLFNMAISAPLVAQLIVTVIFFNFFLFPQTFCTRIPL